MQIDVAPETERLVREEILSGHFQSADEVIRAGVEALREKKGAAEETTRRRTGQDLIDACAKVRGLLTDQEIDELFTRNPSTSRPVDLGREGPSELIRPAPEPKVKAWIAAQNMSVLYVSVVSFGELRKGITLRAPGKRGTELETWWKRISRTCSPAGSCR
jgi:Arc/MetJ-type ribon-helix-helix transcriptional regulator